MAVKYEEDIYPSHLETCRGDLMVLAYGVPMSQKMPVVIFTWWDLQFHIAAMSHQSLQ